MLKKKVTFFLPDSIGGVSTVIRNYLSYTDDHSFESCVVKVRNTAQNRARIISAFPDALNMEFPYSHFENRTKVYQRLYKFMPDPDSAIIATDALELGMAHYLRLSNRVIFVVMGDFQHYYNLAVTHQEVVDLFVAISDEIAEKLRALLPHRVSRIKRLYFPVPDIVQRNEVSMTCLRVIFVGRFDEAKGLLLIPKIDAWLKENHSFVNWTLVGDGPLRQQFIDAISGAGNFNLVGFLSYPELIEEYKNHDVYLLPSKSEGLPISLIEAMKSGLVPVVSDLPGGIREVVAEGVNGFRIDPGNADRFAAMLYKLDADRELLKALRERALSCVVGMFDPTVNATAFFETVSVICSDPTTKSVNNRFTMENRLDRPFIPNGIVQSIRKLRSLF
jgi:glycosyltransferase involved in cell wall biosynthesis